MNYTNREVVRRLKQYDMFQNSLNLTNDEIQKERICDQLDKIEKQILLDTNTEYEEEYLMLLSKKTKFLDEEKTRLRSIITLINDRKEYLNKRKNEHKKITGSLVELTSFLGEDKLSTYKRRLDIIDALSLLIKTAKTSLACLPYSPFVSRWNGVKATISFTFSDTGPVTALSYL